MLYIQGKYDVFIKYRKKEPIKARELSKLMYGITELFCNLTEEDLVTVTINLNSPGKVTVVLKEGYNKLKKGGYSAIGNLSLCFWWKWIWF